MRKAIINFLKSNKDNYISGEEIAKSLDISRAAVWKHIQILRQLGYKISSCEKRGYKLEELPDLLLSDEIQFDLNTKIIGKNIVHYFSIDSTNRIAKELAGNNFENGTVIVAEEQTGGKGRLNRSFFSPKSKSILFSLILRPDLLPREAPKFTLLAAVAVASAMIKFDLKPSIKWPNDILFDGRKVVGILTEMSAEMSKINYIVVGVGINVNINREEFPPEIREIAASLSEIKGKNISRVEFFKVLLEEFDQLYQEVIQNGFKKIFDLWRKYNITLGKKIRVIPAGEEKEFFAVAEDIDEDGTLIVKTENGIEKVYAGDVSIRE
ncbi:MAG: biotin--[Selenomonadaceae bacterium]|nr:biotin--[acetyl-CoA-carboxylase] ligase [Selenomonadaceae bacterium]